MMALFLMDMTQPRRKVVPLSWTWTVQEVDDIRAARNANAAQMKGKLDAERRQELVAEGKRLKDDSARLEEELAK